MTTTVKTRGFEPVSQDKKQNEGIIVILPVRADAGSAGYDFAAPYTFTLDPGEQKLIWTDVKAYMQEDEVLVLHVRSSIGIKRNISLANVTGIIDATYYNNFDNEGNIGICLRNNGDKVQTFDVGERIAQGIFQQFLVADNDEVLHAERGGGFGSSGSKING